jgi:adenylosuccinate synthase
VIGVTKAYVTRVGAGPFPTEDQDEAGTLMQERGQEFGTTTGRRRRCGWFDAVLLRYAARVNGLTELFLTKLDVLSSLPSVKVCVAYRYEGEVFEDFPPHQSIVHKAEPVYEDLEGWPEELSEARGYDELPPAARKYVERLADLGGVPIRTVSVGPSREQTVEVAS